VQKWADQHENRFLFQVASIIIGWTRVGFPYDWMVSCGQRLSFSHFPSFFRSEKIEGGRKRPSLSASLLAQTERAAEAVAKRGKLSWGSAFSLL